FVSDKNVQKFMDEMHQKHGFTKEYLESIFKKAKFSDYILSRYTVPKRSYRSDASWDKYAKHIVVPIMFTRAKKFKKENYRLLSKIAREYQVPINLIVAVAGVESNFGRNFGNFAIFDALTTLAFFNNRKQAFFRYELEQYLLFCREKKTSVFKFKGSFAGAMGWVQQLPSINRKYGVDYNNDGVSNPWDKADALATIANFLHQNGWDMSKMVAIPATYKGKKFRVVESGFDKKYSLRELQRLGLSFGSFDQNRATLAVLLSNKQDEVWLGSKNFDILTHYNNSVNYAMALYKISTSFK
ncbi:MAG: lytic murein transglycosylase, partial [Campylobacterales bacterium]|nr:lytic murein transglycosylase [Campylobacterales bacterium]